MLFTWGLYHIIPKFSITINVLPILLVYILTQIVVWLNSWELEPKFNGVPGTL